MIPGNLCVLSRSDPVRHAAERLPEKFDQARREAFRVAWLTRLDSRNCRIAEGDPDQF